MAHAFITILYCTGGTIICNYRVYQKNPQTIENDLFLEFQWPSTKLNVKSAKY